LDFSVAICAYNASKTIAAALDAVLSQSPPPSEVIVVDDGSSDNTSKIIDSFSSVKLIVPPENRGIGWARNRALSEAKHEIVIFVDADAVPQRGCFGALLKHLSKPGIAAVGGRGEEFFRSDFANRFRALNTPQSLGLEPMGDAPMFLGVCFALNKELALEAGGFDPKFKRNGEDADLSLRLKKTGHRIFYEPMAVVNHLKHDTVMGVIMQAFRFGRGMMRALRKNKEKMGWYLRPATKNLIGNGIDRLKRLKLKEASMFFAAYCARLIGMAVGFFF